MTASRPRRSTALRRRLVARAATAALGALAALGATAASEPPARSRAGSGEAPAEDLHLLSEEWSRRPAAAELARRYQAALAIAGESQPAAERPALGDASARASLPSATSWSPIGAGLVGNGTTIAHRAGRIRQLAYAYDHGQSRWTLWAGTSGGGLWKQVWIFSSPLWVAVSDALPGSPSVGAFLVDPTNSQHLLIGSGDDQRYRGSGLYRSLDAGVTWQRIDLPDPEPSHFFKILMSGGDSDIVLAATDQGIFRSINRGDDWVRVQTGLITDLAQHPTNSGVWYAGQWGVGVLKSVTTGQSFTGPLAGCEAVTTLPAGEALGRISVAAAGASDPDYVFAMVHKTVPGGHTYGGTYRSADAGCHWTEIDPDYPPTDWPGGGQGFHTGAIAVDPDDADRLFVGMQSLTFTEQATQSASPCWTRPTGYGTVCTQCGRPCPGRYGDLHADFHQVLFVPDSISPGNTQVLFANDGGYVVYDYATGAVDSNGNLQIAAAQAVGASGTIAASASDASRLLAGLWDNGIVLLDTDGSPAARVVKSADGGNVSFSPDDASHLYYSSGVAWGRFLSLDGGGVEHGVDCGLGTADVPTMLHDPTPAIGTTVATFSSSSAPGGARVRLMDATDFDCAPGWIAAQTTPFFAGFEPRLVDQANNSADWVFYVSAWGRSDLCVLDSDDPPSSPGSMVPKKRTPPIAPRVPNPLGATYGAGQATADRSVLQPNTVYYVTLDSRPSQAFVSTNRGLCWREVTGSLAFVDTNLQPDFYELLANPANLDQMFLATDVGVFRTDNALAQHPFWYRYMEGLPAVLEARGLELSWDGTEQKLLRINSFGRGFWQRLTTGSPSILFADGFETGDTRVWGSGVGVCQAVASTSCG